MAQNPDARGKRRWRWLIIPTLIAAGFQARVLVNRAETEQEALRIFREVTKSDEYVEVLYHGMAQGSLHTTSGLHEMHWFAVANQVPPLMALQFQRGDYVVRISPTFAWKIPGRRVTLENEAVTIIMISRERQAPWWYWPGWAY